jgi:hypothetical protein
VFWLFPNALTSLCLRALAIWMRLAHWNCKCWELCIFLEWGPWDTNSSSFSWSVLHLRKTKVYNLAHNCPPLVPVMSNVNPVHTIPSFFFYGPSECLLMPRFLWDASFLQVSPWKPWCYCAPLYNTYTTHLILLDLSAQIAFGEYNSGYYDYFHILKLCL